jgi:integrase
MDFFEPRKPSMSVQRYEIASGKVRYRARVKSHGREVATRVFVRKADAVAWEQDQSRRLRIGEWTDPRRGQVPLSAVAAEWLACRGAVKRRTRESDEGAWRNYIEPRLGSWPVASITSAEVSMWMGSLIARGLAGSTVTRALATLRLILGHAVLDGRLTVNAASSVKAPRGGHARREGQALDLAGVADLEAACTGRYAILVSVLALTGLRWGELSGLQVGDLVSVPGCGLRVQRAVLASRGGGELFTDSVKSGRARTVPLVAALVPVVDSWADDRPPAEWLFPSPGGGPLRVSNWKRSVGWTGALAAVRRPGFRVHDLRHSAASIWLGSGADPKVVQAMLGHATATMTMDLYGHLIADNLWSAAGKVGGTSRASAGYHPGPGDSRGEPHAL